MSNVQAVTDGEFESLVLKSDIPVLVDFWATWCGPCRMIAPIVEQIHGELGDKVKIMKMDIDENPATPMSLGIMSIPTVIIFKDGKPAERTFGYRPTMKGGLKAKPHARIGAPCPASRERLMELRGGCGGSGASPGLQTRLRGAGRGPGGVRFPPAPATFAPM